MNRERIGRQPDPAEPAEDDQPLCTKPRSAPSTVVRQLVRDDRQMLDRREAKVVVGFAYLNAQSVFLSRTRGLWKTPFLIRSLVAQHGKSTPERGQALAPGLSANMGCGSSERES
jgi:hypothetical protein